MKKTIIFVVTLFFLLNAKAQTTNFGLKGGMNASELHVKDNSGLKTKIGFNAGVLAQINASRKWAIQPELVYSLEGARSIIIPNGTINTNLSYLNVPVLLQYSIDNSFRVEAGPQIGFLLSARNKGSNINTDIKDDYKSTAFSIPVGLSYLTMNGLGFDARYIFGISNINANNNSTVKNNVFQFGLFYKFKHS